MQRLSRPLIKTDINRASRLFFRHCKVNKSNSICKIIRSYLVHFYTNETFCTPKTNIFTKKQLTILLFEYYSITLTSYRRHQFFPVRYILPSAGL